jgi:hypothetical protein
MILKVNIFHAEIHMDAQEKQVLEARREALIDEQNALFEAGKFAGIPDVQREIAEINRQLDQAEAA